MALSLSQLAQQLQTFRLPIVDREGRFTADFQRFLYSLTTQSNEVVETAQTAADAAQTSADSAQTSAFTANTAAATAQATAEAAAAQSTYSESNSPAFFNADGTGTWPAGNPTLDITTKFYDKDDAEIASRVLRGTLTSATGNIAVTNVSTSGLTTSYALTGDGSGAVKATITLTLGDGSKYRTTVNWGAINPNVAGSLSFTF